MRLKDVGLSKRNKPSSDNFVFSLDKSSREGIAESIVSRNLSNAESFNNLRNSRGSRNRSPMLNPPHTGPADGFSIRNSDEIGNSGVKGNQRRIASDVSTLSTNDDDGGDSYNTEDHFTGMLEFLRRFTGVFPLRSPGSCKSKDVSNGHGDEKDDSNESSPPYDFEFQQKQAAEYGFQCANAMFMQWQRHHNANFSPPTDPYPSFWKTRTQNLSISQPCHMNGHGNIDCSALEPIESQSNAHHHCYQVDKSQNYNDIGKHKSYNSGKDRRHTLQKISEEEVTHDVIIPPGVAKELSADSIKTGASSKTASTAYSTDSHYSESSDESVGSISIEGYKDTKNLNNSFSSFSKSENHSIVIDDDDCCHSNDKLPTRERPRKVRFLPQEKVDIILIQNDDDDNFIKFAGREEKEILTKTKARKAMSLSSPHRKSASTEKNRFFNSKCKVFSFWMLLTICAIVLCVVFYGYEAEINTEDDDNEDVFKNSENNTNDNKNKHHDFDDATMSSTASLQQSEEDSLSKDEVPCALFLLQLATDQFGNETTWELVLLNSVEGSDKDQSSLDFERQQDSKNTKVLSQFYSHRKEWTAVTNSNNSRTRGDHDDRNLNGAQKIKEKLPSMSMEHKSSTSQEIVILSGGPYSYVEEYDRNSTNNLNNAMNVSVCLPVGLYRFIVYDTMGNGICCNYGHGGYGLQFEEGKIIRPFSDGDFLGSFDVTDFEVSLFDIDPASSDENVPAVLKQADDHNLDAYPIGASLSPSDVDSLSSLVTIANEDAPDAKTKKSFGILFDIETSQHISSLTVTGMEVTIDTTSPTHYEVWTKDGPWKELDQDNPSYFSGFRLVAHGTIDGKGACDVTVAQNCEFSRIPINSFEDVVISGGGVRQSFWVTLLTNNLVFQHHEGHQTGHQTINDSVQISSPEFKLYYGASVLVYPLEAADPAADFRDNTGFLGRIWYKASID